jgi:hypothetical protein
MQRTENENNATLSLIRMNYSTRRRKEEDEVKRKWLASHNFFALCFLEFIYEETNKYLHCVACFLTSWKDNESAKKRNPKVHYSDQRRKPQEETFP